MEVDGKMETFNHRTIWIEEGNSVEDAAASVGAELAGVNAVSKEKVLL